MKNEDIEETYNQILKYYDFAEELKEVIRNLNESDAEHKIQVLEPMIQELEKVADKLSEYYLEYLKNSNGSELTEETKRELNELIDKIEKYKDKIYQLYSDNN